MTIELTMAAWALVLAFVQILLFDVARTGQYGLKWNMGPRDADMPSLSPLAGRLKRAQDNLFETLPLFLAAVLIAHAADKNSVLTALGTQIFLGARVVYVPLYAFAVTGLRSLVWIVSIIGLGMIVWAILSP
ncbi:MAG: MAPEG family protein [Alphaproteobacteria bacterium]|jgi:uncharacterized MAPEG superfamily protein|nr:MAPEG family protein [Alphaproteobacteria bacterium]